MLLEGQPIELRVAQGPNAVNIVAVKITINI